MAINWNNIRPLNTSLTVGFEKLVFQLAAKEKIKGQKRFFRMEKPDADRECSWEMEEGSCHMWKAKYFITSLQPAQWTQIDKRSNR